MGGGAKGGKKGRGACAQGIWEGCGGVGSLMITAYFSIVSVHFLDQKSKQVEGTQGSAGLEQAGKSNIMYHL